MAANDGVGKGLSNIVDNLDLIKNIQIGRVIDIDDPYKMGRIKVYVPGTIERGGDKDSTNDNIAWCYPMIPKFFNSTPKVDEAVLIFVFSKEKGSADRLYLGPIISQLDKLNKEDYGTALNPFTFRSSTPSPNVDKFPALNGVFPKTDDISIQGRYNTDLIFRKNEILLRAGKFVETAVVDKKINPYAFQFNAETPGYIQIKNNVNIKTGYGTAVNIVGSKINLLTHKDGSPRFNLANQDNQLSDDELLKILDSAHPLPFGDILVQYLRLFKKAFFNHVHSSNGTPPTDLTIGQGLNVKKFNDESDDLENNMLSKNIRIN
jgi:hypothetical protein